MSDGSTPHPASHRRRPHPADVDRAPRVMGATEHRPPRAAGRHEAAQARPARSGHGAGTAGSSRAVAAVRGARGARAAGGSRGGRPPRRGATRAFFGRGPRGCLGRLAGLLLLLVLTVAGALGVAYARTELPNPNALASAQVNIVYFDDGKTEIGRITSGANRESVELDAIPGPVQKAFLAAEDRSFYDNQGISPSGIARAFWVGIRGGSTQGGSTITQQYVKNTFLTQEQSYKRKIKEVFLAIKLDQERSKEEILRDYLNTIYFGRGAYGIQTAAKAYFDKDVSALTPAEGAVLAAIVKGPKLYDPSLSAANLARNTERAKWILDGETELGWLKKADRVNMTIPAVVPKKPAQVTGGTNGYLVGRARYELKTLAKVTDADIERGGLRIVTSVNASQQAKAVEAVEHFMPQGMEGVRIGMAAVVPGTGAITAMYGGPDFLKQPFDDAWQNAIPGGSTFKVFTMTAALEQGVSTRTMVDGNMPYVPPGVPDDQGIDNAEGEGDMGYQTMRDHLAHSTNTAFARLNWAITPEKTAEVANRLGVPIKEVNGQKFQSMVGNTLGITDTTPVQMAAAYATYAAKGVYAAPHLVSSVKTEDGDIDYTAPTNGKQVVEPKVAADVVDAMERVVTNGTATASVRGRGLTRPAAGKTGTGEHSTSAWFDGFVPQLAAAVSMQQAVDNGKGAITRKPMAVDGAPVYGGGIPTKIWARFMLKAMEGQDEKSFPDREGVGTIRTVGPKPKYGLLLDGGSDSRVGTGDRGSDSTSTPRPRPRRTSTDTPTGGSSQTAEPDPTRTATPTDAGPPEPAPTTQAPTRAPQPPTREPMPSNTGIIPSGATNPPSRQPRPTATATAPASPTPSG